MGEHHFEIQDCLPRSQDFHRADFAKTTNHKRLAQPLLGRHVGSNILAALLYIGLVCQGIGITDDGMGWLGGGIKPKSDTFATFVCFEIKEKLPLRYTHIDQ